MYILYTCMQTLDKYIYITLQVFMRMCVFVLCVCVYFLGTKSTPPGGARPPIGSYSAVWPGVIFPPPSRKQTREEATQVHPHTVTFNRLFNMSYVGLHGSTCALYSPAAQVFNGIRTL